MHRMRRGCLIAGFFIWIALDSRPSQAQYTANFQTNIISGITSNWTGTYCVGCSTFADVLLIRNGGILGDNPGSVGESYGSSNNMVLVSDPGSVWSNYSGLFVGTEGGGNTLVISNGGHVVSLAESGIGWDFGGTNTVLVTGSGSVWSDPGGVAIGDYGRGNRLVISDGGQVLGGYTIVGLAAPSNAVVVTGPGSVFSNSAFSGGSLIISNGAQVVSGRGTVSSALVTGAGSVWNISTELSFPYYAGLVISNGGLVVDGSTIMGSGDVTDSNNTVRVVNGGTWQSGVLYVGDGGSSNSVVISGGSVSAANLVVGFASTLCNNVLELDSGSVTVTNGGTGVLEVRYGELILSGGVLQADTLVITNPCAQFVHTGGTLIVSNVVLDPNTFRIVSVARQSSDMLVTWMMGPGATNTLQATAGDGSGGYSTNGFKDIFIVTNNTTVGTVTNFFDIGAATNKPARYYRARLVP